MATAEKNRSRRWAIALVLLLAVCAGCQERRLAPEIPYDSDKAETLRESFDNFYQSPD